MAIGNLTEEIFIQLLKAHLSPSSPIRTAELLRGRDVQLREIGRSIVSPGRQIFIYGDRGVGKTSLAQTAAFQQQHSSRNPIFLTCSHDTTVFSLARDLTSRQRPQGRSNQKRSTRSRSGASVLGISAEKETVIEDTTPHIPKSINAVVDILLSTSVRDEQDIVVVDEIDQLTNQKERRILVDLIKQLGDQNITTKFISCGVAELT
ncbi:MAG: AAA family ATPase [Alphaproteobacteria bacterium]